MNDDDIIKMPLKEGEEVRIRDESEVKSLSFYHDGKPLIVWNPNDQTVKICGTVYALSFFEAMGQDGMRGQFNDSELYRFTSRKDGVVIATVESSPIEMRDLCKRMYETLLDFTPSVGAISLQDYDRFNEVMTAGARLFDKELHES